MDSELEFHAALAALGWQTELGADEALGESPVNRYEEKAVASAPVPASLAATTQPVSAPVSAVRSTPSADKDAAVSEARSTSAGAASLDALRDAMAAYDHCELKRGAKNLVFSDGLPGARVMIVGEAPGRDEDIEGLPFVGRAGQLLDRMFAAIRLSRRSPDPAQSLYITNVMVWRPPQNREPSAQEVAMLLPFLERHIELANPQVLVIMGNTPLSALLGTKGITRLRGKWAEVLGRPALPMFHPAYLLRTPSAKREAWADLLSLQAKLREKMNRIDDSRDFVPVRIAILTVSDSRTPDTDTSGDVLAERLTDAGHVLAARAIERDDRAAIVAHLLRWCADPAIDVVLTTGGTGLTGRDVTVEAHRDVYEKEIDAFGMVFTHISMAKIGTSAVQSRACGGVAKGTYLFALPGSPSACRDAWDEILIWQLDYRHKPCNFVEIMPRLEEHRLRK